MNFYPVSLNLKNKKVLVVGGGHVALRKIDTLLECGARVTVISPQTKKEIDRKKGVKVILRPFKASDINGSYIVIAATNDNNLNEYVAASCRKKHKLINVIDNTALCDFIAPAVIRRGDLVISISSSGDAPFFTKYLAEKLRKEYGKEYSGYLRLLAMARRKVVSKISDHGRREKVYKKMLSPAILNAVKNGKIKSARSKLEKIIEGL